MAKRLTLGFNGYEYSDAMKTTVVFTANLENRYDPVVLPAGTYTIKENQLKYAKTHTRGLTVCESHIHGGSPCVMAAYIDNDGRVPRVRIVGAVHSVEQARRFLHDGILPLFTPEPKYDKGIQMVVDAVKREDFSFAAQLLWAIGNLQDDEIKRLVDNLTQDNGG
ncbi:MAG: hypothetical protein KatS3mg087_0490 [Patescibacteria group bacterium]|nr:MAG: hypothetical protein KatS3mg087_0490 [Patescibacteria group bacterium]